MTLYYNLEMTDGDIVEIGENNNIADIVDVLIGLTHPEDDRVPEIAHINVINDGGDYCTETTLYSIMTDMQGVAGAKAYGIFIQMIHSLANDCLKDMRESEHSDADHIAAECDNLHRL